MKFTTRITEADYVAAYRLKCNSPHRHIASAIAYMFAAIFWLFLIAAVISKQNYPGEQFLGEDASRIVYLTFPSAVLLLAWILAFRVYPLFATRRKFRQAKTLQGETLNEVTAEGLWQKTPGGSYGFSVWQDFSFWRESKAMIIVVYSSDVYCLLPKANLSSDEVKELRDILTKALPKR